MSQTETIAERVGRNDAIFREANESIVAAAQEHAVDEPVPFICECAEPGCTELVRLGFADYESVRSDPTLFINAPGHVVAGQGWARVVEHRDGYDIVEKVGRAAEVAEELDPRAD